MDAVEPNDDWACDVFAEPSRPPDCAGACEVAATPPPNRPPDCCGCEVLAGLPLVENVIISELPGMMTAFLLTGSIVKCAKRQRNVDTETLHKYGKNQSRVQRADEVRQLLAQT